PGAHVIAAELNLPRAKGAASLIAGRGTGPAAPAEADITDTASVAARVTAWADAAALVVTPGANVRRRPVSTSDEELNRLLEHNLKGTYRLMRGFGREMADRGRGSIVTYASFRALAIEPGQGLCAAAKAGVVQLTKTLASELGDRGV